MQNELKIRMKKWQRRSHNKSRTGCTQCKLRKIKCDERHPQCSNCERREIACIYPAASNERSLEDGHAPPSLQPVASQESSADTSSNDRSQVQESVPLYVSAYATTKAANVDDLELMHHWSTTTSVVLGDNGVGPSWLTIWQTDIPNLAFNHEFLIEGILTVAAQHMSYTTPSRRSELVMKASAHQQVALAAFQRSLRDLTPDNCVALFSFAWLSIPMTFSMISKDAMDSAAPESDAFNWLGMLRGGYHIFQMHRERIQESFLKPLIDSMLPEDTSMDQAFTHSEQILALNSLVDNFSDEAASQACRTAVQYLAQTFIQNESLRARAMSPVLVTMIWPTRQTQVFMDLIDQRSPEALVILAHYCVLIHRDTAHDTWFLIGCARHVLNVIRASIPDSWLSMLDWPESMIGKTMDPPFLTC